MEKYKVIKWQGKTRRGDYITNFLAGLYNLSMLGPEGRIKHTISNFFELKNSETIFELHMPCLFPKGLHEGDTIELHLTVQGPGSTKEAIALWTIKKREKIQ